MTTSRKQAFKKSASPKVKQQGKRPTILSLRLTFEERTQLERVAAGESLSAYIRSRLFGNDATPRRKRGKSQVADYKALSHVLGALGDSRMASNLNQLAKAANMGALPVTASTEAELKQSCAHIKQMRLILMQALGLKSGGKP